MTRSLWLHITERITYQFIIWQDRTDELDEASEEVVDFLIGGIDSLRKI